MNVSNDVCRLYFQITHCRFIKIYNGALKLYFHTLFDNNFILQALACYTPKFLWDMFEGGLLRTLVMGLNIGACHDEEKKAKKTVILDYLTKHVKVSSYKTCIILCNSVYFISFNKALRVLQSSTGILLINTQHIFKCDLYSSKFRE